MIDSPWFVGFRPVLAPALRWFAFPHAGGAASAFRPLSIALPPSIELVGVQPPGRWNRIKEAPHRRVLDLVDAMFAPFVSAAAEAPFALWGHSLGALVAFELARRLQREGKPAPRLLLVSARRDPTLAPLGAPMAHLDDEAFINAVDERYGGINPAVRADKEMMALTLPALRADMEMYETYRASDGDKLLAPIVALRGVADPITSEETVAGWAAQTRAGFRATVFPGGHFFPFDASNKATLIELLRTAELRA